MAWLLTCWLHAEEYTAGVAPFKVKFAVSIFAAIHHVAFIFFMYLQWNTFCSNISVHMFACLHYDGQFIFMDLDFMLQIFAKLGRFWWFFCMDVLFDSVQASPDDHVLSIYLLPVERCPMLLGYPFPCSFSCIVMNGSYFHQYTQYTFSLSTLIFFLVCVFTIFIVQSS